MNKSSKTKRTIFFWVVFFVLIFLIGVILSGRLHADIGRSIHDGTWIIRYTDCQGNLTTYENATVLSTPDEEIWLTIEYDGGRSETKLPLQTTCAEIRMDRER